jgi:hypothetical protein
VIAQEQVTFRGERYSSMMAEKRLSKWSLVVTTI